MSAATFKFESDGSSSVFTVVNFLATEGISKLYRYEIDVKCLIDKTGTLLDDVLNNSASFITSEDGNDYSVYGAISSFEELQTTGKYTHFKAILVPRLWDLSVYKTNEVYTDNDHTLTDIISQVLENAGLTHGTDYTTDFITSTSLLKRNYTCQFGESDFDFISRLCENEGVYFYFDHSSGVDKIVFADDDQYTQLTSPILNFEDHINTAFNISSWVCRKQRVAEQVSVRDYNPASPSLDLSHTSMVDSTNANPVNEYGIGADYLYGGHIKDEVEAETICSLRAEEVFCKKTRYYANSTVARLRSGYEFELKGHGNSFYNDTNYVVLEIQHEGKYLDNIGQNVKNNSPQYSNSFSAIESAIQFRPQLLTPKPRFYGTMTAFIYSEMGADTTDIDEFGQYRVSIPFDRSESINSVETKATTRMRMAQDYVDEEEGTYYPLTHGTEVLLSFINGDPDQPLIIGAVPNAGEPSLATAGIYQIVTSGLLSTDVAGGTKKTLAIPFTNDFEQSDFEFNKHNQSSNFEGLASFGGRKFEDSGALLDREDGLNHTTMIYGDQYNFTQGNVYNWGDDFVIGFGNDYEEIHQREDNLAKEAYDLTAKMQAVTLSRTDNADSDYSNWKDGSDGLVEKTWGDKCEYHEGREFNWSGGQGLSEGGALEVFNYGNGYTENLLTLSQGTSADLSDSDKKHHDKWMDYTEFSSDKGKISVEKTFGPTYSYQNGFSLDVKVGKSVSFTYGNSESEVEGDNDETIHGHSTSVTHGSSHEVRHGATSSMHMGASSEMFLGVQSSLALSGGSDIAAIAKSDIFLGASSDMNLGPKFCMELGPKVEIGSAAELQTTVTALKNKQFDIKNGTLEVSKGEAVLTSAKIKFGNALLSIFG